ncbi:MAG TPA: class I SAM-dependent methyltransferase [Acidimicrobiales bacterium]|nr:class I SAM-dependent methyltransferase [Acidimicrobiales bacterium]
MLGLKDVAAGDRSSARALVGGLARGAATGHPPAEAARRACPYCGGPLLGRFGAVADWRFGTGVAGDVYRCGTCGALAAGRVPSPDEVASWYADYYTHSVAPRGDRPWSRLWPTPRRRRELERLRWYFAHPGRQGRFLEVGTGSGERLVQFAEAGWTVVGQDLDPKAGHVARGRGITVHHCPVEQLVAQERPFDLIGLSHVLEHATDPVALLDACAALLAPGGRLCVVSPNADSFGRLVFGRWWYGLEQPRHLAIPTLESLARITSQLDLEPTYLASAATNGAVILGGSLDRVIDGRLANPRVLGGARFVMHSLGQAVGRGATLIDRRRGEEVVWVGRRRDAPGRTGSAAPRPAEPRIADTEVGAVAVAPS